MGMYGSHLYSGAALAALLLLSSLLLGLGHVALLPPWEGFDEHEKSTAVRVAAGKSLPDSLKHVLDELEAGTAAIHTAHDLLAIAREVRRLAEVDPPGPPRANANHA